MNVGIVGCGSIAKSVHIPALQNMKNVEIVAVCDNNEYEAKKTAKMFKIDKYSTNIMDMLAEEKLDLVDICTPPQTHADMSIQAMEAGCHVLLEKPFVSSKEEANQVIITSEKSGVKLCVLHNYLYKPIIMKAKSIIDKGGIGDLLSMNVKFFDRPDVKFNAKNHWSQNLQGGRFGENIIHPLYLIDDFLGITEVIAVHAKKIGTCEWTKIDELKVLLNTQDSIGAIALSTNAPRTNNSIEISGTKGIMHIDLVLPGIFIYEAKRDSIFYPVGDYMSMSFKFLGNAIIAPVYWIMQKNYIRSGHYYLIQKFIESIQDNKEPPVTGEKAKKALLLQEKIFDCI